MPLSSLIVLSALAGIIFTLNANAYLRRRQMTDAERDAEDREVQKVTDEGW